MAVDVREPELTTVEQIRSAFLAKAGAEAAAADALMDAPQGAWGGLLVGARIAFVVGVPAGSGVLESRVRDAVEKVAQALGTSGAIFTMSTRPVQGADPEDAAHRARLLIEAVDPPVVIALDPLAAEDIAEAFEVSALRPGGAVRAFGRALGSAGDLAASLDDPKAKARAWSSMKAAAVLGGLDTPGRSTSAPDEKAKG